MHQYYTKFVSVRRPIRVKKLYKFNIAQNQKLVTLRARPLAIHIMSLGEARHKVEFIKY